MVMVCRGAFTIDASFAGAYRGYKDRRLERGGQRFLEQLLKQTGLLFFSKPGDSGKATLVVHTDKANKEIQELGEDESCTLEVTSSGARLGAANPLGVLRGLQTFLQLVEVSPEGFAAPAVTIKD